MFFGFSSLFGASSFEGIFDIQEVPGYYCGLELWAHLELGEVPGISYGSLARDV